MATESIRSFWTHWFCLKTYGHSRSLAYTPEPAGLTTDVQHASAGLNAADIPNWYLQALFHINLHYRHFISFRRPSRNGRSSLQHESLGLGL